MGDERICTLNRLTLRDTPCGEATMLLARAATACRPRARGGNARGGRARRDRTCTRTHARSLRAPQDSFGRTTDVHVLTSAGPGSRLGRRGGGRREGLPY
eukprot:COSAG02_NODE_5025_length_4719_cov_7.779654_4_plen_100_part_00